MHYSSYMSYMGVGPFTSMGMVGVGSLLLLVVVLLKGVALWHAAKRNERVWFAALLLINTLGILELVYLFAVVKIKMKNLA